LANGEKSPIFAGVFAQGLLNLCLRSKLPGPAEMIPPAKVHFSLFQLIPPFVDKTALTLPKKKKTRFI
jgi:hypothetical protein